MNCFRFASAMILVYLLSVGAFAGQTWYPLTSAVESEPTWEVLSQTQDYILLEVQIPGFYYETVDKETRIEIPGCQSRVDAGMPEIPNVSCMIGIANCNSYPVDITPYDETIGSFFDPLYPKPIETFEIINDDYIPVEEYFRDEDAYATKDFIPSVYGELGEETSARSQHIITVHVYPVRYNPSSEKYSITPVIQVQIDFDTPSGPQYPPAGPMGAPLDQILIGYQGIPSNAHHYDELDEISWDWETANWCDYLIIADDRYFENGEPVDELMDYALYREATNGYDVVIVNYPADLPMLTPVDPHPERGSTDAFVLKMFIRRIYNEIPSRHTNDGHMSHAFFIGDIVDSGDRLFIDGGNYGNLAGSCDAYYAKIDMNADENMEELLNKLPDIFVGRLPIDDELEIPLPSLSRYADKIISAEQYVNRASLLDVLYLTSPGTTQNGHNPLNSFDFITRNTLTPVIDSFYYLRKIEADGSSDNQDLSGWPNMTQVDHEDVDDMRLSMNSEFIGGDRTDPESFPQGLALYNSAHGYWNGWSNYHQADVDLVPYELNVAPIIMPNSCYGGCFRRGANLHHLFVDDLVYHHPDDAHMGCGVIIGACAPTGGAFIHEYLASLYTLEVTQAGEILFLYAETDPYYTNTYQIIGDPAFDPILGDVNSGNAFVELVCEVEVENIFITQETSDLEVNISNISTLGTQTAFDVQVFAVCGETEYLVAEETIQGIGPDEVLSVPVPVIPGSILPEMSGYHTFRFEVDMTPGETGVIPEYFETDNNFDEVDYWITPLSRSGYPRAFPNIIQTAIIEDLDPEMNNGPELFSSTIAINILDGTVLWEQPNASSSTFLKTGDIDYNSTTEIVFTDANHLYICDGHTGTLLYNFDILYLGSNEYKINVLPYDIIPLTQGGDYSGMEFIIVGNPRSDQARSFLALYSLNYATGTLQLEWENEYREYLTSIPTIGHFINQSDFHIAVSSISETEGVDDLHRFYILNPVDGTTVVTEDDLIGTSIQQGNDFTSTERCASGDMDGNGLDEVYFLTTNSLYRYDYSATPELYLIENEPAIDYMTGMISLGNGFLPTLLAESPGVITQWGEGRYLAVDLSDPANPSTMYWPDAQEPGSNHDAALIGQFYDPTVQSVFCGHRGPNNENMFSVMTGNGVGFDNFEYRLLGNSAIFSDKHWLYDIDDDGYLDYVYLTQTNVYGSRYIDVIEAESPGMANWSNPNGENGGTRHLGPIYHYLSGSVTGNVSLQGTVIVTGNVTVQQGAYLSFLPGTEVLFEDNTYLTIRGQMDANGFDDFSRIHFHHIDNQIGAWYGIFYDEGSSGLLDFIAVEDATDLITVSTDANVSVLNFELSDFTDRALNASKANLFAAWDGTITNGATAIECYRLTWADIRNIEITQCDLGMNLMVTQPLVMNVRIHECIQDGASLIDCAGGVFEDCTFERNHQNGVVLYNSTPQFNNCVFSENLINSLLMTSASNAILGVVNDFQGNTFYNSGDPGIPGFMQAELNCISSRPVFANRHNDFISTDGNHILCDQTFNGIEYNGTANYFEGNPVLPSDFWFWPSRIVSLIGADPQMNYPERIPTAGDGIDELDQALILERDGNYREANDLFHRLIREQSSSAAFNGWIRCQLALGNTEIQLLETMDQFEDCDFLESTIFWTNIYLHNRIQDYETAISLLDSYIESAPAQIDSLSGMLAELNIYYEMLIHASNPANGPVLMNESATASSPSTGNHLLLSNENQPVAAMESAEAGRGTRTSHGAVREEIQQMGAYDYPAISNASDYFTRRNELLRRIGSISNSNTPEIPTSFELASPYPNPFNPTVQIPYNLPEFSSVRIQVYNILGQRVATLVDAEQPAGFHRITWDGTTAAGVASASGVYFVTMNAGPFSTTKKIVLLK